MESPKTCARVFLFFSVLSLTFGCQATSSDGHKQEAVKETVEKPRNERVSDDWPAQAAPHSTTLTMPTGGTGFYSVTQNAEKNSDLMKDFGAIGDGKIDDSAKLQKALNKISNTGGGTVFIPKAQYVFSGIKIKSNTHIEIEAGTVIRPVKSFLKGGKAKKGTKLSSITIFDFGKRSGQIENVSIVGKGGAYIVELHAYKPGITVFGMGNVDNFQISNVNVKDALTKFSAITMGPSAKKDTVRGFPTNGYVSNFTQTGAAYGYGVVQTQAAQNVLFENLHGEGGAVLRMETGAKGVNDDQFGGLANVIGKNISCKDGNAAFMISPHAMHNGVVAVDGVRSDGCGFAVRIGHGYIAKKYSNPNLEAGTYAQGTRVSNIHSKFGKNAQLKSKHFKYMPERLLGEIASESEDGSSHRGPSIAPVLNIANYPIEVSRVTSEGFSGTPDIATKRAPRTK